VVSGVNGQYYFLNDRRRHGSTISGWGWTKVCFANRIGRIADAQGIDAACVMDIFLSG
jgi:hypothetical protein